MQAETVLPGTVIRIRAQQLSPPALSASAGVAQPRISAMGNSEPWAGAGSRIMGIKLSRTRNMGPRIASGVPEPGISVGIVGMFVENLRAIVLERFGPDAVRNAFYDGQVVVIGLFAGVVWLKRP